MSKRRPRELSRYGEQPLGVFENINLPSIQISQLSHVVIRKSVISSCILKIKFSEWKYSRFKILIFVNFQGQSEFPVEVCVVNDGILTESAIPNSGSDHDTEQHPELSLISDFWGSSIGSARPFVLKIFFDSISIILIVQPPLVITMCPNFFARIFPF